MYFAAANCRLPRWRRDKEPDCQCRRHKRYGFGPWVGKIPWRRVWQPTQYSCLENPMDRGARWTTIHRVVQSWTELKRLSKHAQLHSESEVLLGSTFNNLGQLFCSPVIDHKKIFICFSRNFR